MAPASDSFAAGFCVTFDNSVNFSSSVLEFKYMSLTSNRDDSETSKATPEPAQAPRIRSCIDCRHYRLRPKAELFGPSELQTPGGLKAYNEWQQQEKQHAEREAQLVASGGIFTYEPHHYA